MIGIFMALNLIDGICRPASIYVINLHQGYIFYRILSESLVTETYYVLM